MTPILIALLPVLTPTSTGNKNPATFFDKDSLTQVKQVGRPAEKAILKTKS
jgi:hypothetical protein